MSRGRIPGGVAARPGEDADRLIKRFTRYVRDEGIIQEVYDRRAYEKPSLKLRKKHFKAIIAMRKNGASD